VSGSPALREQAVVIEGLVVSRWSGEVFEGTRAGGILLLGGVWLGPREARGGAR
jgi:hypothetical protein